MKIRNFKIAIMSIFIMFGCAFSLTACNQAQFSFDPTTIEKAEVSSYLDTLNATVNGFKASLSDFDVNVKDKNIDELKTKLDESQKVIDNLSKTDVPDKCKEINQSYLDGFVQMQQALSNYVQVYSDFVGGSLGKDVLNQRIADVQNSYNSGLTLINKADKLVAEIQQ